MNVAIVHFHLNTGGVTTVIRHQVAALAGDCRVVAISGEPPEGDFPGDVAIVPALAYDARRTDTDGPDEIARAIERILKARFPGGCDVVHVHNPTLAKNRHWLAAIDRLRQMGHTLFLQIHDFAEDGRLDVYPAAPYPADCHYGVINARDLSLLKAAGLNDDGLHFIPNAVSPMPAAATADADPGIVLYPVRAIRRKNIGEAILMSAFFPERLPLAITLPPTSPADRASYRRWRQTVDAVSAPVIFEAGLHCDFDRLVGRARAIVTTSVSEGFGFAFLEPWTAGKHLIGRKLPGVVADMQRRGVDLSRLYTSFQVPLDWIDRSRLSRQWASALGRVAAVTGAGEVAEGLNAALQARLTQDALDFGLLHETLQVPVVTRLFTDASAVRDLMRINPFLENLLAAPDPERMQRNKDIVLKDYALAAYRESLLGIYRRVASTPVSQRIDRRRLLTSFLTADNFSLLKWLPDDT